MGWKRWLAGIVTGVGALVLGFGAWVVSMGWGAPTPGQVDPAEVVCAADAPPLPRGRPLKVLMWNLQYGGTRKHHFFYDGGPDVHVPEADVRWAVDRIALVIAEQDPDLVILQEVDRGSDRTHRIDELAALLDRLPYGCHAATPYHQVAYVPTPSQQHLGKVDMHLAVLSRYRIDAATRTQLPLLDEPWWRRIFNLRRALLDVSLPIDGGGTLRVFDTHLSAFSKGDGTLDKQVAVLDQRAAEVETRHEPWLLAGDLNALPPGDDASRLGHDAALYAEDTSPVKRLFDRYDAVVPLPQLLGDAQRWRTYIPFGADLPDRVLDYVFVGRAVDTGTVQVLPVLDASDHLPILVEITLP
ncbi:MAG: endonuclease/exonuclease/phosphatase family protein [Alphaproteobacteria bacterium]|nr:endonuclease/exonuclease/phosphatase family protein [Alphaproteobacteria bacterium]